MVSPALKINPPTIQVYGMYHKLQYINKTINIPNETKRYFYFYFCIGKNKKTKTAMYFTFG